MKCPCACVAGIVLIIPACGLADVLHVPERYPNIQTAINFAVDGDEIVIADGVYTGPSNKNLDCLGLAITIRSKNGPENCIIDCEGDGRAFNIQWGETSATVVDGFTIVNGNAYEGGSMRVAYSKPMILNCVMSNCRALVGGAIRHGGDGAAATFKACLFDRNASDAGGAIYSDYSIIVESCTFTGNSAAYGGAVYGYVASIASSDFAGNIASEAGGAIYGGANLIMNSLFESNAAPRGAGLYLLSGTAFNCTIARNEATAEGGGLYTTGRVTITNTILWNNTPEQFNKDAHPLAEVTYCLVEGNWPGSHNIDADPLFVAGPKGDFYLSNTKTGHDAKSPCINAGYGNAVDYGLNELTNRIDGKTDRKTADLGYHYPRR